MMIKKRVNTMLVEILLPVPDDYNPGPVSIRMDAIRALNEVLPKDVQYWSLKEAVIEEREVRV